MYSDLLQPDVQRCHNAVGCNIGRLQYLLSVSEMDHARCGIFAYAPILLFFITGKEMAWYLAACVNVETGAVGIKGLFARVTAATTGVSSNGV